MDTNIMTKLNDSLTTVQERLAIIEEMHTADSERSCELEEKLEQCAPLAYDLLQEVDIELSAGGPSDGFKLYFDKEGQLRSGLYYCTDFGTYEEYALFGKDLQDVYKAYENDIDTILYHD